MYRFPTSDSSFELKFSAHDQEVIKQLEEDATTIQCTTTGGAVPDGVVIAWYQNDKPIENDRIFTFAIENGSQLMFAAPTVSDSGNYKCMAKVGDQVQETKTIKIEFLNKPKFIDPETEQHPEEGKNAEIKCKVQYGEGGIFWKYNGKVVKEGGPRAYVLKDEGQTLFIPNFEAERDDGPYVCFVQALDKFFMLKINVTAYAKPIMLPLVAPENNIAYEGQNIEIKCHATGKPMPIYKWTRKLKNEEIQEIKETERFMITNGVLSIKSLLPSDQGSYTCTATNPLDSISQTVDLSVFRKPKIEKMDNLTKTKGERVELKCTYDGDGDIKVKWVHLGEEFGVIDESNSQGTKINVDDRGRYDNEVAKRSAEGVEEDIQQRYETDAEDHIKVKKDGNTLLLIIEEVKEDDSGGYQCVAENDAGRDQREIFLSITREPTITSFSMPQKAVQGGSVMLHCEASAVPDPEWSWQDTKNNTIVPDGETIKIDSHSITSKLIISPITAESFGTYYCIASNNIGSPTGHAVEVVETAIPDTPSDIRCTGNLYPNYAVCKINTYIDVSLGKLPNKLNFQYVKDNEDFEDSATNFSIPFNENTEENEYYINNLTPETRYRVRISATNEAGTSDFSESAFLETSEPKVPEIPGEIHAACNETCFVDWVAPNDMGAPITKYRIQLTELRDDKTQEETQENSQMQEVDATSSTAHANLGKLKLKPLTTYKVRISAINEKGEGDAQEKTFTTLAQTSTEAHKFAWGSTNLVLAIAFILLFLLFVVDLICFATNRCGIIACFCTKCLGRPVRAAEEKDVEQGNRSETNRLLSEGKNEPRPTSDR